MSNQNSDPAEALRQIKAQWLAAYAKGPLDQSDWAFDHADVLLAVAEAALEYEPAVHRFIITMRDDLRDHTAESNHAHVSAIGDMRTKQLDLLEALQRLGQRAGEETT